jgi:hypothetical protein
VSELTVSAVAALPAPVRGAADQIDELQLSP